ncbi:CFAP46 [Branchiostoma lanceolatum]|uniref:CFAP46 protein n=1 Tax=Branchiostoma lanceolatum TaxID=7740 RepID=A0A8K0EL62_BRALA|nr:CFAP46 [Branchiostoma lanceolatum]
MDTNIRTLLSAAQKYGAKDGQVYVDQAFEVLKGAGDQVPAVDSAAAFGLDLYVICAELGFQYGHLDITNECLRLYFLRTPPPNQFLCRAYLCQAQMLAPTSADNPEQLEKAVVYLLKAISFAKETPRYHFLVYNASVLYWQMCRPFLKPNHRQHLAKSLHQVVRALDEIDDKDYEWRAQLMIALIECLMDSNKPKDAENISNLAATFTRQNVPSLFKDVFRLQIKHKLGEPGKALRDLLKVTASGDLAVYYKICKLKTGLESGEPHPNLHRELFKILRQILQQEDDMQSHGSSYSGGRKSQTLSDKEREKEISANPPSIEESSPGSESDDFSPTELFDGDGTGSLDVSNVQRLARRPSVRRMSLSNTSDRSSDRSLVSRSRSPSLPSKAETFINVAEKPPLLLELGRLCLDHSFPDLATQCVDGIMACPVKDEATMLQTEFMNCDLMVKNLKNKMESYTKSAVEVRVLAIKRLMQALQNAVRYGDPNVIQAGCVTQWNMCLPLLQLNLRQHVRKPLTMVAEALEDIDSLLILLRCQVHTELAKCEEDQEQIEVAMDHLRKAILLDDSGQYRERLETMLHRLQLRIQLYKTPERQEDQAAMIIEQARKSSESGTVRMKRSLLVRAGQALAPDAFLLVLDSESETKAAGGGKGVETVITQLAAKARQFEKSVKKAAGHLKRLGDENDRERAQLWADLAKTARKQEVWDVCRVACRFCLLYDDGRWKPSPGEVTINESPTKEEKKDALEGPVVVESTTVLYDRDLVRMLAEVHFINSEAMVHLLRSEGVQLNNQPIPPVDKSKHPKGYVPKKPEEDPDWLYYCDWIKSLSGAATSGFLRAAELGVELHESWVVCSSAAYLWNYNNHLLTESRHRELVEPFTSVVEALKKVGHAGEAVLLTQVCNALAYGLIQPWIPPPLPKEPVSTTRLTTDKAGSPTKKASQKSAKTPAKTPSKPVAVDQDGMTDIKKALEVCDFALDVTSGNIADDVVPISIRHMLIITWVRVKQMVLQQIKNLGVEDEGNDGQRAMTRCLVALEMTSLNGNGLMDFSVIKLDELSSMVDECVWTEGLVELQVWTRLAEHAYAAHNHQLVMKCAGKALEFDGKRKMEKKLGSHGTMVEAEMLSYSSDIMGLSLVENMAGNNAIRRSALEAFLNAARYAGKAGNYSLVIIAARHYWNTSLKLIPSPMERELLRDPLLVILKALADTYREKTKPDKEEKVEEKEPDESKTAPAPTPVSTTPSFGDPSEDLTLRASMYGVVFQSYADRGQWEEGLKVMDEAVRVMPRTKHRLLIFQHRVLTKAKLGKNVQMDIQKFKDESEAYVALMWHRVAKNSKEPMEQLAAYQQAIVALQTPSSEWQKIDYLIEFAEWLFTNGFSKQDAQDMLDWAADILLNMQFGPQFKPEETAGRSSAKRRGKGKGKQSPPATAKPKPPPQPQPPPKKKEEEEEDGPDRYIPVSRPSQIGVEVSNSSLLFTDLWQTRQLEALLRIHVMLAKVAGKASPYFKDFAVMAYRYCMRIWEASLQSVPHVIKEMARLGTTSQSERPASRSKGDKKDTPAKTDKPKRKGPVEAIPATLEDWASYDIPEEAREAFKHDSTGAGVNKTTITKPTLTLHYMETLADQLRELGYNHLALPILTLAEVIGADVLGSKAMSSLWHTRMLETCLEINLLPAAGFHEQQAGPAIAEEDQAVSREEIAKWHEQQEQVRREELRLQQSQEALGKFVPKTTTSKEDSQETAPPWTVSGVNLREVWTDKAEVLLRLGYYQGARTLLGEAHKAAKTFGDQRTEVRTLKNLARLSILEANLGQAVRLLQEAQALGGDEEFWFQTVLDMADAVMREVDSDTKAKKAKSILLHAITVYKEVLENRSTKADQFGYFVASFEAKLATIQLEEALDTDTNAMQDEPVDMKEVLRLFQGCAERLLTAGYPRRAAEIMQQHAGALRQLARAATIPEQLHSCLLEGRRVLGHAVSLMEELLQDVQTLTSLHETQNMSLPLQREVAGLKVTYAELLGEIFEAMAREDRNRTIIEARKGSLQRMVEDYIRSTPDPHGVEKEWGAVTATLPQSAIIQLTAAHSLARGYTPLRAKSLYLIGRVLSVLSAHLNPDHPSQQWELQYLDLNAVLPDSTGRILEEEQGEDEARTEPPMSDRQQAKYTQQARQLKGGWQQHQTVLAQASEVLVQCLKLSLQHRYTDIAGAAALELLECMGQYDPASASQYLALFQSCHMSQTMSEVLQKAQLDPSMSRQAALMHQRAYLLSRDVSTNLAQGTVMKNIVSTLSSKSQAWKRLSVDLAHLDLLKELPPNFTIFVLQHSPDKCFLYGSVLDKPAQGKGIGTAGDKKGAKQTQSSVMSRAKVARQAVHPEMVDELLGRWREFRSDVMQLLLRQEGQRTQYVQRMKMLQNIDSDMRVVGKGSGDDSLEEWKLQERFSELVGQMEDYLKPIISQFDAIFRPSTTATVASGSSSQTQDDYILLLADQWLMQLPLEALNILQNTGISSLSRDFSLQMLYHRIHREAEDEDARKDPGKAPKSPPKSQKGDKKPPKTAPIDRFIPPGCLPLDTSMVKYVVDPYEECSETEEHRPIQIFSDMMKTYPQLTGRWEGIMGEDHIPSLGEWENLMTDGSGFVFYGMERLACYPSSIKLATMNLQGCMLMMLLDHTQTNKSFRRQSKADVHKNATLLSLEKHLETAMLLSLSGVGCVLTNQWHCTLEENAQKLNKVMKDLLGIGKSSGQAVRGLFIPHLIKEEREGEGEGAEENKALDAAMGKSAGEPGTASDVPPTRETLPPATADTGQEDFPTASRQWFSMVVYGLPNLILT